MNIQKNVSLSSYSTMALGGPAAYLTEIHSRPELTEVLNWIKPSQLPVIMIGGGSNIVWQDSGFKGLIIVNKIPGYEQQAIDETNVYLTIGAGENWDSVVKRSVEAGLTGIEALSLIPGTAGATPIQNVGAYGQEISQTLVSLEAYDTQIGQFVTIPSQDCDFSYRNSRFKSNDKGRFFITGLTLHLTKGNPMPPFYGAVQAYFEEHGISEYTPATLRNAVIEIRHSKLPDPAVVHNCGSFFANPILTKSDFAAIPFDGPPPPNWATSDDRVKVSAAWLIEQAGFKNTHDQETGMATWPLQSLVLVNETAKSTADLLKFKQKITDTVQRKFGVTLDQEPELLP